ncbi:IS3 family transposase [Modestobacter lapidis]|nr:IS3 family transposase [Modestobacter lapidis]
MGMRVMAAPRKYPDELRERATRKAVDARRDPATAPGERDPQDRLGALRPGGARPPAAVIVEFIDADRDEHGVEPTCEQLQIAPSTYYAHRPRPPSARSASDAATTAVIEQVHAENIGVYGARKVHAELRRQGHRVARCTVERLMHAAGLRGTTRAKGPRTTVSGHRPGHPAEPGRPRVHPRPAPTSCGSPTSPTAAPSPAGSTPPSSSTSTPAGWWAGSCPARCAPTWPDGRAGDGHLDPPARRPRRDRADPPLGQGRSVRRRALHPAPRRGRRRRVHRLVQPPAPARRDRPDPTGRARGRLPPAHHRGDDCRRVSSEPPVNPGRDSD